MYSACKTYVQFKITNTYKHVILYETTDKNTKFKLQQYNAYIFKKRSNFFIFFAIFWHKGE